MLLGTLQLFGEGAEIQVGKRETLTKNRTKQNSRKTNKKLHHCRERERGDREQADQPEAGEQGGRGGSQQADKSCVFYMPINPLTQ